MRVIPGGFTSRCHDLVCVSIERGCSNKQNDLALQNLPEDFPQAWFRYTALFFIRMPHAGYDVQRV